MDDFFTKVITLFRKNIKLTVRPLITSLGFSQLLLRRPNTFFLKHRSNKSPLVDDNPYLRASARPLLYFVQVNNFLWFDSSLMIGRCSTPTFCVTLVQ